MLKEARDIRDREISEAKVKAKAEADALMAVPARTSATRRTPPSPR
jgi:hypothetical protein